MSAHPVGAEVMKAVKRREVDFLTNALAGRHPERLLSSHVRSLGDWLALAAGDFKTEPSLPVCIVKIDISSGQIRDREMSNDRFISNVLEPRQLEFHLDLGGRSGSKKECGRKKRNPFHRSK